MLNIHICCRYLIVDIGAISMRICKLVENQAPSGVAEIDTLRFLNITSYDLGGANVALRVQT